MRILVSTDDRQPNDKYFGALLCAGALPEEVVLVKPGDELPPRFDGLLIAGGADVDPSRYGEAASTDTLELNPSRDGLDFTLFGAAEKSGAPIFGICRGMQMMNVALGGTLWQDIDSQRPRGVRHDFDRHEFDPALLAHEVRAKAPDGGPEFARHLARAGEVQVNSRHHQAVKDLAAPLAAVAASPDDLVEACVATDRPYLAGVQWHPEDLVADPVQKALFRDFLDQCRAFAARRGGDAPPIEVSLEGRIPVVRLNRPAKRNAFAGGMREMLAGTIETLGEDPTVPAIVLTGAGGAFSAGGDLDVLRALVGARDTEGFRALLEAGARVVLAVMGSPKPVIAAIDGPAAGAGMNLALACDVRVAASSGAFAATFAQSFAAIGLAPDWGGTYHLPLLAGAGAAADLVFSAERITAQRAKELGIVDLLVEEGSALPAALGRAAAYAERDPAALAAAKRSLNAERLARVTDALLRETREQIDLFANGSLARGLAALGRTSERRERREIR
jgi:enoyl-CoA hydratase/carnithine racemase/gamma-glutamyl-gamma-aminobutyrate hydrolase PuuD